MKNKVFFVAILLTAGFLCFGIEPNDKTNNPLGEDEERIQTLEKRLDALEWRLNRLESPPSTEPAVSTDKTKDELRTGKLRKKIDEIEDAIELAKKRIESLPFYCCPSHCPPRYLCGGVRQDLETAKKEWQLLSDQEKNYKLLLQLAEKYSDLGIDVMDVKKKLIECQGRMKEVDLEKKCLREFTRTNG